MVRIARILGLILTLSIACSNATAETITVACASNFKPTLEKLARAFEQQSKHRIRISSASSGVLFAQINNGAPFQLFFSADAIRPEKLVASGKANEKSLTTYAIGRLVLLHHQAYTTDPEQVIAHAKRIAIANPAIAPYGVAAKSLLNNWPVQKDAQVLQGNNIAQALQFFQSGHADAALVAASLLSTQQRQSGIDVTTLLTRPIRQKAVLINSQKSTDAAMAFMAFIRSGTARQIITDSGYLMPL